jgi:NAD(P)-dependent dehydrogenase (short-subunit alcohol dehydrogenase family)
MQKAGTKRKLRKAQHQNRPGSEYKMQPSPIYDDKKARSSGKLHGKVAVITGGDSGIGRAVAILFAKEGADIAVIYLNEHVDAEETKRAIEEYGQKCLLVATDISIEKNCAEAIKKVHKEFNKIDILINNAAIHYETKTIEDITTEHLLRTFSTNVFSFFWITKNCLKYMPEGSSIINTTSVTAYRGSGGLIDYASTKGAIVSFTRSLSANLVDKKIRVNAVAPGPIWTPLIVSSYKPDKVSSFGSDVPMKRAGEPYEVATSYLFLASDDSSYITGQVLHPNGGEIVNA